MGKKQHYHHKKEDVTVTPSSSELHEKVFKKWKETRTKFNINEARKLVTFAPNSESPADLLTWASNHPFLRIKQEPVPEGIISNEDLDLNKYNIYIIDVAIRTPMRRHGGRITDDDIYDAFPIVRKYVPRGMTFLKIVEKSAAATTTTTTTSTPAASTPAAGNEKEHAVVTIEPAARVMLVTYAMKKFTGGPGDDDDQVAELEQETEEGVNQEIIEEEVQQSKTRWEQYFVEPVNNCVKVIQSGKENGESAHLAMVKLDSDTVYYITGSKTSHLIVRKLEDVDKYSDSKVKFGKLIARTMLNFFATEMTRENLLKLENHLVKNQLTAVFEYLDLEHQHVEKFDFEKNQFRFITFTSQRTEYLKQLVYDDMTKSIEFMKQVGFKTIDYKEHTYQEIETVFQNSRNLDGKEGSVLYYLNKESKVIGLVKKKSIWYIMVRAIREKVKPYAKKLDTQYNGTSTTEEQEGEAEETSTTKSSKQTSPATPATPAKAPQAESEKKAPKNQKERKLQEKQVKAEETKVKEEKKQKKKEKQQERKEATEEKPVKEFNLSDVKSTTKSRIKKSLKQKKEWLNQEASFYEEWKQLSFGFIDWLAEQFSQQKLKMYNISNLYPEVWAAYMSQRRKQ